MISALRVAVLIIIVSIFSCCFGRTVSSRVYSLFLAKKVNLLWLSVCLRFSLCPFPSAWTFNALIPCPETETLSSRLCSKLCVYH